MSTGRPSRWPTDDLFFMLVWTESLKMAPTHSSHTAGPLSRGTTNTIQKWTRTPPLLLLLLEQQRLTTCFLLVWFHASEGT